MLNRIRTILCVSLLVCLPGRLFAESLETQSNPVANGAITVEAGVADRTDWEGIPWFEFDDDFTEFYPIDIDRLQVAHDATNLYVHITALEWDTEETWRVGTYLDTDQDSTTGYTGDFLPLGADYFLEDASAFSFTAATQAEWGWTPSGDALRDQSDMLDVEIAIPRLALGNPTDIDFILYANNTFGDFQMPDDIYPSEPGGVFTYELGEPIMTVPGDCNGDNEITALDLGCVDNIADRDIVLTSLGTLAGDLDGDGAVAFADFLTLSSNFGSNKPSYTDGNVDLEAEIGFPDFLILSSNFGKTVAATAAVPEPGASRLCLVGLLMLLGIRRR